MLTGENGIIRQATESKEKTIIGYEKEGVNISYSACISSDIEKEIVTAEELEQEMIRAGYDVSVRGEGTNLIVHYNETGHEYRIEQDPSKPVYPVGPIDPTNPNPDPEEPKEPVISPEPEGGGTKFDQRYGVVEVKFLKDDTYYTTTTANPPQVDESKGMKLVKFNESSKTWEDGNEYAYLPSANANDEKLTKWANAKLTIDGTDNYFVWIPRYAYKITYFDSKENRDLYRADRTRKTGIVGYSDSRGFVDVKGKKIDGVPQYRGIDVGDYYAIHPAFTPDADMGGGFGELKGIWVGKYETSDSKTVQPGISSQLWRYAEVGNMYTYAKSFKIDLKSHMLKNSEWGAAVYLADSQYGRNGNIIGANQCTGAITGAGASPENKTYAYDAETFDTTYAYYTENGMKASTTGNVYGIYDMAGGQQEYVACYGNTSTSSSDYQYGNEFASSGGVSDEFATAYSGVSYIKGDAVYETMYWYGEQHGTPSTFSCRSGYARQRSDQFCSMGLFYCNSNNGMQALNENVSYRIGLIVQ